MASIWSGESAIYSKADLWEPYLQVDEKLITGQNPASSELAAEELLKQLYITA